MLYRSALLPALALLILLPGCDSNDNDGLACTLEARPGISVKVMIDNGETPDDGIYDVTITEGSYTETEPVVNGTANLAVERAGTYDVNVTSDGNPVWHQDDVEVTDGECHVNTVELLVLVEPS